VHSPRKVGGSGALINQLWSAGFVLDSLLEEDRFELPVPGRIYSAAMRSQVISRCSSLFAGPARWRNEDHALALEAHPRT
jgi:hypothetical protein